MLEHHKHFAEICTKLQELQPEAELRHCLMSVSVYARSDRRRVQGVHGEWQELPEELPVVWVGEESENRREETILLYCNIQDNGHGIYEGWHYERIEAKPEVEEERPLQQEADALSERKDGESTETQQRQEGDDPERKSGEVAETGKQQGAEAEESVP